jgi:UDP-glucose 6-dehydrogenase
MDVVKATSEIVGVTVAFFPKQVAVMLNKNGVTVDAENYNSEQLVSATIDGLVSSPSFLKEFSDFVERNR